MENLVGRAVLRLTGFALLVVAFVAAVAPRRANIEYHWPVVVPVLVVAVAACLALRGSRASVRLARLARPRWVAGAVAGVGTVLTTVAAQAMSYEYGWDARFVMNMARSLHGDRPVGTDAYDYLSLYPNNIPLLVIDRLGVELGDRLGLSPDAVLLTVNGLCVGATMLAVHALVARLAGRSAALVAQVLVLVLVGLSPWAAVPYTDLPAMPFLTGGLALVLAAPARRRPWSRLLVGAAGVACVAVAYVVKTTPAVAVVALVLTGAALALAVPRDGRRRVATVATGLGLAVGAAAVFAGAAAALDRGAAAASGLDLSEVHTEYSPPILWWVANGMNEQRSSLTGAPAYGTYNREMVLAIYREDQPFMKEYAADYIRIRWEERGLQGMAAFYGNKLVWNWGDGMFWAWGEGPDLRPGLIHSDSGLSRFVNQFNGLHGRFYAARADVTQGLWLALLVVAGLGLLRVPYRRGLLPLALSVLGIAAFTVVFQGRSRYVFAFVPVVVALAAGTRAHLPALGSALTSAAAERRTTVSRSSP